mmetsp:Transcript_95402/g.199595  ORF Transcript_95402/g.199595 Transcript_95402/m.199595 type:complete len:472 (-) Transcript_95402:165-1580(-)|eukprot:CAMPEP_0206436868 /NCGR_PEP_ID=MMETSP0324_2-20121206/10723_1 /ASSEMBLY_ACC=CAM_ASM_000836 /TAXON_ID=2866 /ORGANISM="Crypthecodinium cohnii, Strain Seligo" /LENGTH=471 /DNA_ID=CAMNT_0053904083 /DNA_START=38 /DNA_END=1453 /DNA_ORIENTATION=-
MAALLANLAGPLKLPKMRGAAGIAAATAGHAARQHLGGHLQPSRFRGAATAAAAAAIVPDKPEVDFAHHAQRMARLNHGSFGACPLPVLRYQYHQREAWLSEPDTWFFSGRLDEALEKAARSAGKALTSGPPPQDGQICLVDNATFATVAIARRWGKKAQAGDVIVTTSFVYLASLNVLREYCELEGARIEVIQLPFPCKSAAELTQHFEDGLKRLKAQGANIRFALLDHVSSQPAIMLPVKEMVQACRAHGAPDMEVAIDGAHSVGSTNFDVKDFGCDWFFSNLHKWGFAPTVANVVWSATPELMADTRHPIPSWSWGKGLNVESRFTGTMDYSSLLSVPAAMEYLQRWRSEEDESSVDYCHRRVLESSRLLAEAWGTADQLLPEELVATQAMVRLPPELVVTDLPGQPGKGVRQTLRERYCVEAAIGNFGPEIGSWVRLSYAVYNTERDIARLKDAVLEILEMQQIYGV